MFLYGSKSPVQKRIINAKQSHEIEVDTGEIVLEETLLKEFHDRQLPRWKQEADNIIKKYSLEIVAD